MMFLFFVGVLLFIGFCAGWSAKSYFLPYSAPASNPVVDEMRLQRARDYVNNPVVNELKREKL